MPRLGERCSGCGHRKAVNGVPPKQTRELAMKNPSVIVTEMVGRARAKRYGRHLVRNGNLNPAQFSNV
jgi:hypothetical protein